MPLWSDADAVRAALAAGGARRLADALDATDPVHQRVWLELALTRPEQARILRLGDGGPLPEAVRELVNLEELTIGSGLRELPAWLASMPALRVLNLEHHVDLAGLPAEVLAMPSLRTLRIRNCPELAALPAAVPGVVHLEALRIHHTGIRELPAWLADAPRLRELVLDTNHRLTRIPAEILAMPSLRHVTVRHCRSLRRRYRQERINPMLRGFARTDPDVPARRRQIALVTGDDRTVAGYGIAELVAALDSPVAAVRSAALIALDRRVDPAVRLDRGDEVQLAGRMYADRAALADRLARLGVTRGHRNPRLLVVGERPGPVAARHAAAGVPVVLEHHLAGYLNAHPATAFAGGGPAAVAPAGPAAGSVWSRLRELLASEDPANVRLALDLMRTGGLPAGGLEDLLAVVLYRPCDPRTRAGVYRVCAQHVPPEAAEAARTALSMVDPMHGLLSETRTAAVLRTLAGSPGVDTVRLATLGRLGLKYLLQVGEHDEAVAIRHLRARLTDGALRLTHQELCRLPDAIARLDGVTELDLSYNWFTSVPEPVFDLTGLETLDLADNRLTAIPDRITRLANLTALKLGANRFDHFPAAVCRLPGLVWLSLGSDADWRSVAARPNPGGGPVAPEGAGTRLATLPDDLREMTSLRDLDLSGCEIGRLPDWLVTLPELHTVNLTGCTVADRAGADRVVRELRDRGVAVLTGVPADVAQLDVLVLDGHDFATASEWIRGSTRLSLLYLILGAVERLPEWLVDLPALTQLRISGCRIADRAGADRVIAALRARGVTVEEPWP